jgi:D-3-phosphoglycerate dehydrogenase
VIRLVIESERQSRSISGTVFADGKPRIIEIKGIAVDAEFGPAMLYVTNEDKPGYIGTLGTTLGSAGVNIATFALGRSAPGGDAIALVQVDAPVSADVIAKVSALPHVKQAKALTF